METALVVVQLKVKGLPERTDAGVAVRTTVGALALTVTVAFAGEEVCPLESCATKL